MEHGDGTAPASAARAWTFGAFLVKSALPVQGMKQASGATRPVTSPSARHQCGGWQWPARVSPPLMRWLAADQLGSAVIDPTPLHISDPIDDDDYKDVTRRNTFDCWAGRFDGTGPWVSEQGGGHVFGGANGSAGGLGRRAYGRLAEESSGEPRSLEVAASPAPLAEQAADGSGSREPEAHVTLSPYRPSVANDAMAVGSRGSNVQTTLRAAGQETAEAAGQEALRLSSLQEEEVPAPVCSSLAPSARADLFVGVGSNIWYQSQAMVGDKTPVGTPMSGVSGSGRESARTSVFVSDTESLRRTVRRGWLQQRQTITRVMKTVEALEDQVEAVVQQHDVQVAIL
ncbi:hypothetical protein E2562_034004 [Oryza meyeriana var. granulata]|uniref:Uncharacterized protein n=1 Tax=Oryza meyeriana var. granulata TaxID=110450 RepID=A0A6G1ESA7_9ORYZ|nr:hypothetical protein E2562_034004 [Oryza meyeriana var. granulata]